MSAPKDSPKVVIGQIRADKLGGTIMVAGVSPARRFIVRYPQLDGEVGVLGAETIRACYPIVVGG